MRRSRIYYVNGKPFSLNMLVHLYDFLRLLHDLYLGVAGTYFKDAEHTIRGRFVLDKVRSVELAIFLKTS